MKVEVVVKPNSRHRHEVVKNCDGSLTIYIKDPPIENRANKAVIALLSEYYQVPKSTITIHRGAANKRKVVAINI